MNTQVQVISIKFLLLLGIGTMLMGLSTLNVFAQDEDVDTVIEEVTQEVNDLRVKHSALKAQVNAGEITAEEARAEWQSMIDDVRARKKVAFDNRIDKIQARYERIFERNPELAEKIKDRIENAHSRRAEVADNRRAINQKMRDGEITREEGRAAMHLNNAQAMEERMEATKGVMVEKREVLQDNREERRIKRTPPSEPEAN